MKIQKIQAFPLAYPEPHYKGIERYITLARVETEDGIVQRVRMVISPCGRPLAWGSGTGGYCTEVFIWLRVFTDEFTRRWY